MVVLLREEPPVGYWPKELFTLMSDGAKRVAWGGVAKAGKDGICPPMGNGHFPDGYHNHSSYFANMRYVNRELKMVPPLDADIKEHNADSNCYGLNNEILKNQKDWGYSVTFGGPGGRCAQERFAPLNHRILSL